MTKLLPFLLLGFACVVIAQSGGLQLLQTVNWPGNSNSISPPFPWYKPRGGTLGSNNNTLTGDAGFVAAYRDLNSSNTWWVTREWIGVVENDDPTNTTSLRSVFNYHHSWLGVSKAVGFVGIDADRTGRKLYTCTRTQNDCWEIRMDTPYNVRKIYMAKVPYGDFTGMVFDEVSKLVWIIGDSFIGWVQPPTIDYWTPNPPDPPRAQPNSTIVPVSQELTNGAFVSLGVSVKMYCIFKDYKPRDGRATPFIYVGGDATLYRTEAQNNAFRADSSGFRKQDFESRPIGAGIYYTGVVNPYSDVVYLGSSLGLGLEVDLETFALNRIFFFPGDQFDFILVDEAVSFWMTQNARLIRVNSDQFTVAAQLSLPRGNLLVAFQDIRGRIHVGTDTGGVLLNEFKTFVVQKTNCSAFTCDACFTEDKEYCGICKSNGLCTLHEDCPTEAAWEQNGVCPANFELIPADVSIDKLDTKIRINGAFFEPLDTVCVFYDQVATEGIPVVPEIGRDYLICQVPTTNTTSTSVPWEVGVRWQNREWGNRLPLTFYDCSTMSCGQCFDSRYSECGWCLEDFQCRSAAQCIGESKHFTNESCPAITKIEPPTASIYGGETIEITVTHTLTDMGLEFNCSFGSVLVPAFPSATNPSKYSCTAPQITATAQALNTVSIKLMVNSSLAYTPFGQTFTYYDCNKFDRCGECSILTRSKCAWCGNPDLKCVFSDEAATNCTNTPVSCPVATLIKPVSDFIPTSPALYTPITATISGANFENMINMKCVWQRHGGPALTTTASRPVGPNEVVCSTPSVGAEPEAAEYSVHIAAGLGLKPQTSPLTFLFYNCDSQSCSDCLDPRKKLCNFCKSARHCWSNTISYSCSETALTNQKQCISLTSVHPSGDGLEGGVTVTLKGSFELVDSTGISCEWIMDDNGEVRLGNSTYADATRVDCTTPGSSRVVSSVVRVVKDNKDWTNAVPFDFYQCNQFNSCATCVENPAVNCAWCASGSFSCTGVGACDPLKRITGHCPILTSASPDHAIVSGGDGIIINGGPFVSTDDQVGAYTCKYDGVLKTAANYINSQQIQCLTPRRSIGQSDVTVYFDDVLYTPNSVAVQFFDCAPVSSTICSEQCTNQTYCGWCVQGRSCGSQAKCNNLWLPQCLKTTLPQPYANLVGNETIRLISTNVALTGVVDSDLKCNFGTIEIPAKLTSAGSRSTITCQSPKFDQVTNVVFNTFYLNNPLIEDQSFAFVDCKQYTSCGECAARAYCGWCLDTNKCSTESFCPPPGNYSARCPDLASINPQAGDVAGDEPITITGIGFVDNGKLAVYFGEAALPTVIVNSTMITATTVKTTATGPVDVSVRYEGATYSVSSLRYTFSDRAANTAATAGGIVAGLVVLAGVGVGGFFLYKRKFRGALLVNIREPDYVQVAYGTDLEPHFRMPLDEYKKLEGVLSRPDFGLQLGLASFCPATEQDLLAKSLVYIAYDYDPIYTIDLLTAIIQNEVESCIQENTIFRGNSIASKMFKFYSRMTGIKYLWRCMARIIAELETLGAKEIKQQEAVKQGKDKKKDGTSLLAVSMELDENKLAGVDTGSDLDVETNILQLKLTCQKLFAVLVKNSVKDIPVEFRRIFQEIDEAVMKKFGSDDASFKAIGGFFFLRFVCPAITAPHFYGLLENPPNTLTQRQLVLISKTLQCLANMTVPGKKEKYMERLSDFISNGIPKVIKFYEQIRSASFGSEGRLSDLPITKEVKQNALSTTWNFIYLNQDKSAQSLDNLGLDKDAHRELSDALEELVYEYKTAPKKLTAKKKKTKGRAPSGPPPE